MKRRRILSLLLLGVTVFMGTLGWSQVQSAIAQSKPTLTVSAATSLSNALKEIKPLYEQTKNVSLTYNFGPSGALQQQIEQGAPVDVFISAAAKQMDTLQNKNLLVAGTRRNLLGNSLVLITPSNSNAGISDFKSLTRPQVKRIVLGEPKAVPAGQYAEETLKSMGIFNSIRSKFVYGNNVRQILTVVETGNAEAGIVYTTDAKESNKVKIAATAPANSHSPIVYPIAVIKSSKNPAAAREFTQFLSSNSAKTIFRKYGFTTL